MSQQEQIQLFESQQVRTIWDSEKEEWFFSIVDVCKILTNQPSYDLARNYWKVLKHRLIAEGFEPVTNCNQLKLVSPNDYKKRLTDVATSKELFRIIQSIPSKKAEPFKQWMAQVATERLNQMQNPELNFEQAFADYKRLGYSDKWINQRLQTIQARKELTDEWDRAGVKTGQQYATLTDIITREWSGKTTRQYKEFKGLKKESLRDNMTTMELALNMVAEAATVEISKASNPKGYQQSAKVAHQGGKIAAQTRAQIEAQTGRCIISSEKASDYILPVETTESIPLTSNGNEE